MIVFGIKNGTKQKAFFLAPNRLDDRFLAEEAPFSDKAELIALGARSHLHLTSQHKVPAPVNLSVKTAEPSADDQGQLEKISAQNAATTQFESDGLLNGAGTFRGQHLRA